MNKSQSICIPSAVHQSDNILRPDPWAAFQNDAFVHMQANRAVDGMEKWGGLVTSSTVNAP